MDIEKMLQELRDELRSLREEVRRGRVEVSALLTLKAAARRLGVGPTKMRELVAEGTIATTLVGKRKMVAVSEIERLSQPTPPRAPRQRPARAKLPASASGSQDAELGRERSKARAKKRRLAG